MMEKENYKREKYKVFGPILMKIEPEKGIEYWTFGNAEDLFDEVKRRYDNKEITADEMDEEIRIAVLKDPEKYRVEPYIKETELDEIYKDFGPVQIKIDYAYMGVLHDDTAEEEFLEYLSHCDLRLDAWEFNVFVDPFLELVDKLDKKEITKEQFDSILIKNVTEDPYCYRAANNDDSDEENGIVGYKVFGPSVVRLEEKDNPLYWEFDEMNPVYLELALRMYRNELSFDEFLELLRKKVEDSPEAFRKKSEWEMETGNSERFGKPISEKNKNKYREWEKEYDKNSIFQTKFVLDLDEKVKKGEMDIEEMGRIIKEKLLREGADSFFDN